MRLGLTFLLLVSGCLMASDPTVLALDLRFSVNSTTDAVDMTPGDEVCASAAGECTLRAAIQETNALPGADAIRLPSLIYTLATPGEGEDSAASGDLDITDDITLVGERVCTHDASGIPSCGPLPTIDGGALDRVIHIGHDANVYLATLEIRNGSAVTLAGGLDGGGIQNEGILQLLDAKLSHNIAGAGGGISNSGTAIVEGVAIANNEASVYGGGLLNESLGNLTLRNSSVRDNTVISGNGGGLTNLGTLLVERSGITGNVASHEGGGIENYAGVVATLTSSTISGNSANRGGGLFNNGPGTGRVLAAPPPPPPGQTHLINVTIAENVAQQASAIMNNGTVTVRNGILAGVLDAPACGSFVTSLGHNLGTDESCSLADSGDIVVGNPLLAPLAGNGGPTQTHALLPGSLAIDTADNAACPNSDQRGEPRPSDGDGDGSAVCDIGAYEAQAPLPDTPSPTPSPAPTPTPKALPDSGGASSSRAGTTGAIVAVLVGAIVVAWTLVIVSRRAR